MILSAIEPANRLEIFSSSISGKIVDGPSGSPMEYVNVAVYKSADSSLVTWTISDVADKFKIEKISFGDYFQHASFLGYEKKQIG